MSDTTVMVRKRAGKKSMWGAVWKKLWALASCRPHEMEGWTRPTPR
ncbi:hypothetical protein [Microbacterium sediminis]|nr:hypothetical protein [Microbacterium sediminis]